MDNTEELIRGHFKAISYSCCMCSGQCNHTGPHTYCSEHRPYTAVPQAKQLTGWICPACGAGLSPFVTICPKDHNIGED